MNLFKKSTNADLCINTSDDYQLYVNISWLCSKSLICKNLLYNQYECKTKLHIDYNSTIIIPVLLCLNDHDNICSLYDILISSDIEQLFSFCYKYGFDYLINMIDSYYSENNLVDILHNDLLFCINKYKLKLMKIKVIYLLTHNKLLFKKFNYNNMPSFLLSYYFDFGWEVFLTMLENWSRFNNPDDTELKISRLLYIDYSNLPKNYIPQLHRIVKRFNRAKSFKLQVLHQTNSLFFYF